MFLFRCSWEAESGDLVLPPEYEPNLPECATPEARDVMAAWLKTLFVRRLKFPGCAAAYRPDVLSVMIGKKPLYVRDGWEWLESFGYVDFVDGLYVPGRDPIADPVAHVEWLRSLVAQDMV
jgi:hypothetical protein